MSLNQGLNPKKFKGHIMTGRVFTLQEWLLYVKCKEAVEKMYPQATDIDQRVAQMFDDNRQPEMREYNSI